MPLLSLRHRNSEPCVLTQKQLHQMLSRVDENLEQAPLYREPTIIASGASDDVSEEAPGLSELHRHLRELYAMQAPLFVVKGHDFPNQLKRILNIPLRAFGSKQALFNDELLEAIQTILTQLYTAHHLTDSVEDLRQTIVRLEHRIKLQEVTILDLQQRLDSTLAPVDKVSPDQRKERSA